MAQHFLDVSLEHAKAEIKQLADTCIQDYEYAQAYAAKNPKYAIQANARLARIEKRFDTIKEILLWINTAETNADKIFKQGLEAGIKLNQKPFYQDLNTEARRAYSIAEAGRKDDF